MKFNAEKIRINSGGKDMKIPMSKHDCPTGFEYIFKHFI